MKTKFKYFTMAIVALLMVGFSSCSSDDTPQIDTEETKTVLLKLTSAQPTTRAEGSAITGDATSVVISKGFVYFTTAEGGIVERYTIWTEATDLANNKIQNTALGSKGLKISGLPGNVRKVFIVGNSTPTATKANPIKNVQDFELKIADQGDTDGGTKNVNLYGNGVITFTEVAGADNNTGTATVTVAPTVARIQINDIKPSGSITGFEVAGIFVDNYYSKAAVDGAVAASPDVNHGADSTKFSVLSTGAYGATNTSNIHDWYAATGEATGAIKGTLKIPAKPSDTKVWAYNLFAGEYNVTTPASSTGVPQPRIIIRLKNVTAKDGITYDTDQFITIRGFTDMKDGDLGKVIKAGYVYTIASGGLEFDESNLSPNPNEKPIDVTVTVTLATWKAVGIKPIL